MKVFITHGHNEIAKLKIKDFLSTRLGHDVMILGEQPGRQGLTIIEALEKFSEGCEFAAILLTGDDMTRDGGRRARQNVIHEVGFFQGRLGRSKVVLIVEKGVEIPSNLSGLFYLEYEKDVKEIFTDIQAILESGDASTSAKKLDVNSLKGFVEKMGSMDQNWIQSIAEEISPYIELPPNSFFAVVRPILQSHGDGYARQAQQFKNDSATKRGNSDRDNESDDKMKGFNAMIGFAGAMLIGPSERLANLCHNALTIIETSEPGPEEQVQAKKVVLKMFGLAD